MRTAICATDKTARKQNIALIGFMGSGKTTVAKVIAKQTGMELVDIDANISRKTGKPIKDIFAEESEAAFRKMEADEISNICNAHNAVIDCGGGAVLDEQNRETLQENAIVIWLYAKPKTVFQRIGADDSRPLLNVQDREQVAGRILHSRIPIYASVADVLVNTESKSAADVVGEIIYEISKTIKN